MIVINHEHKTLHFHMDNKLIDPFLGIKIPVGLIDPELVTKTPNDLAFLLNYGWKIYSQVEKAHTDNARVQAVTQRTPVGPAALIGQSGEAYVAKIYNENYYVLNVAKRGRSGDLNIAREEPALSKVLVEVKNYTTAVPKPEVEKFYRDLEANRSMCGGIFVSLNTKISGILSQFYFTVHNRRPVIFIVSKSSDMLNLAAAIIWSHVDSRTVIDKDAYRKINKKLADASDIINQLSMSRTHVNETRVILEKQLTKIYGGIFKTELQLQKTFKGIHKTLGKHFTGGADALTQHEFDGKVPSIEEACILKFSDNLYTKNKTHRQTVNNILTAWIGEDDTILNIAYNKKGFNIIHLDDNLVMLKIVFLKSRTDIFINPSANTEDIELVIPVGFNCTDGFIIFNVDKNFQQDGSYDAALDYISDTLNAE
jgi:hypothetical protein